MRFSLLMSSLVLTLLGFPLAATVPVAAQNTQASTYRPGPWQPIGRLSSKKPLKVVILNQTGILLGYEFLESKKEPTEIPAGQTVTLSSVKLPLFLGISSQDRPPFSSMNMTYNYSVDPGNTLTIQVRRSSDYTGDRVINVDELGALYIY